jgi:hypothetical protein
LRLGRDWRDAERLCDNGFCRREVGAINLAGEAKLGEQPDDVPVGVDFIPSKAVARGNRVSVVIVVPAFAPSEDRDPQAVGGKIASGEAARPPGMSGGIDEPRGVQTESSAEENPPQHGGYAADGEKNEDEENQRYVVELGDPNVKFVLGNAVAKL